MMQSVVQYGASFVTSKPKLTPEEVAKQVLARLPDDFVDQLRKHGEIWDDQRDLDRFLIAREYNVDKAVAMLQSHLEWRKKIAPNGKISQDGMEACFKQDAILIAGEDKRQRPIAVVIVSKVLPHEYSEDVIERICALAQTRHGLVSDRNLAESDGKHCSCFDFRNIGQANLNLSHARIMFQVMQDHFPERGHMLFAWEAPTILWAFWNLLQPFLAEKTKKKVRFIYGEKGYQEMCDVLGEENIPVQFGGPKPQTNLREVLQEDGFLDP